MVGKTSCSSTTTLFFDHFWKSSFVAERESEQIGFLVGFLSPSESKQAYIHFVGVDPAYRKIGVAKHLYERFFELARENHRTAVEAITAPINEGSIRFHQRMRFAVSEPIEGYNRPGTSHVVFTHSL